MSNLYGFFGDKVYRMSTKTKVVPKVIDVFNSSTYVKEDTANRSITSCIKINTMDFYKEESNDALYAKLVEFLRRNCVTGINTLYFSFKIALDYQITDLNGVILDAGIRYIETDAEEVNILLNPDPITHALPYRKAEYVKKKFAITRISGNGYGVMDAPPRGLYFKINAVTIYANLTDSGSEYYVRSLGPSAQNTTFAYNSGTVNSITNHSVVILDTRMYGINIPVQKLNYVPNTIYVSVEALINQFCAVADDSEIWEIVMNNGGMESDAPSIFEGYGCGCGGSSLFDPVINRPPCPGNYPMPPIRPGYKPGKPLPPQGGGNGCDCGCGDGPVRPIRPGDDWDPNKPILPDTDGGGCPCPKPPTGDGEGDGTGTNPPGGNGNENPDDGTGGTTPNPPTGDDENTDLNYEWVICPDYDTTSERFIVVDDITPDSAFDATIMVKYSDVQPFVTDVRIGDYVKKEWCLYY